MKPQVEGISGKIMVPGILLLRLKDAGINIMPSDADARFCCKPVKEVSLEAKANKDIATVAGLFDVCGSRYSSNQGSDAAVVKVRISGWVAPEEEEKEEEIEEEFDPTFGLHPKRDRKEIARKLAEHNAAIAAAIERKELLKIISGMTPEDEKNSKIADDCDGWRTMLVTTKKWALIKSNRFVLRACKREVCEGHVSHVTLTKALSEAYPGEAKTLNSEVVDLLLQETITKLLTLVRVFVMH